MKRNRSGIASAFTAHFTAAFMRRAAAMQDMTDIGGDAPKSRYRATKRKGASGYRAHAVRPAGSKLAQAAQEGRLTKHHASPVDSYFANLTGQRAKAERLRKAAARVLRTTRQADLRRFAFEGKQAT